MDLNIPKMGTIKTTAKLFGLPEHFIRHKVLQGEIVAVKAGKKYLVNIDHFADYLNTHLEGAQTEEKAAEHGGIKPVPVDYKG